MKRNYKRLVISVLAIAMMLTMTACGGKSSPESTVESLFDSAKVLDFETLETLVVGDSKAELEEDLDNLKESFIDSEETGDINYKEIEGYEDVQANVKEIQSDLSYKVVKSEEADGYATVTVEVDYVDGQELITDLFSGFFSEVIGQAITSSGEVLTEEDTLAALAGIFNRSYADFEKVLKNDTVEIHLVQNEDGEWLVSELNNELINVLTFNTLDSLDSILVDMFGGFEMEGFETND